MHHGGTDREQRGDRSGHTGTCGTARWRSTADGRAACADGQTADGRGALVVSEATGRWRRAIGARGNQGGGTGFHHQMQRARATCVWPRATEPPRRRFALD